MILFFNVDLDFIQAISTLQISTTQGSNSACFCFWKSYTIYKEADLVYYSLERPLSKTSAA